MEQDTFGRTRENPCSTAYCDESYQLNLGLNSSKVSYAVSYAISSVLKTFTVSRRVALETKPWFNFIIVYQQDLLRVMLVFGAFHQDLNLVKAECNDETPIYSSRGIYSSRNFKIVPVSPHQSERNSIPQSWFASSHFRLRHPEIYRLSNKKDPISGLREGVSGA